MQLGDQGGGYIISWRTFQLQLQGVGEDDSRVVSGQGVGV